MSGASPHRQKLSPRSIKGVLFDLDGTCVDSEFLSPLAWAAVLREIGAKGLSSKTGTAAAGPSSSDLNELENALAAPELRGASASTIADRLLRHFDIRYEDDPVHLVKRKRALAVEMVVNGKVDLAPLWFEGVGDSIRRLEKALGPEHVGLCTSNLRPIVDATVKAGRLGDAFVGGRTVQEDVIDPSTGLPRIKPKPDLYLLALEKLGVLSELVVALEDSVVGVTSAKKAGVGTVLGVLNRKDNNTDEAREVEVALRAAGADEVFDTTVAAIDWCLASVEAETNDGHALSSTLMEEKEAIVRRYFEGVNKKAPAMMSSCFAEKVQLRDMCGPSKGEPRYASSKDMADRCMEFLAAHPDCRVEFEHPPTCDREGRWVWCHWVESGRWTGESLGIAPRNTTLDVGGHTRFLIEGQEDGSQKIAEQVVYRTFSDWELSL
mmetsp:Transcript_34432/g.83296  ORF Transcript_34432/g.83296 Transcript_34432/m.83296 type:complete len:436 (+) Transcript_34432:77-1384(+)